MSAPNIFDEDWRDCLRAHLFHVLRERDSLNERSLITVLLQTGFAEDEITALRTQTLMALGLYPEEQEEAVAEVVVESAAEVPVDDMPEVQVERAPEPEPDAPGDLKSDKARHKPPDDEPPAPLVQMSLF